LTNKKTLSSIGKKPQDLSYTYDSVGNILQIVDASDTGTKKTVLYSYDDLYRLTSASASDTAVGGDYLQTFTYDPVGNILTGSEVGAYRYDGNIGSNFANPHAVTAITPTVSETPPTSFAYDKNGNLTRKSGARNALYTWDSDNRLIASSVSSTSERYAYDNAGQRVRVTTESGATVLYPSKYFNSEYDTNGNLIKQTSHIFAGETLLATVEKKFVPSVTAPVPAPFPSSSFPKLPKPSPSIKPVTGLPPKAGTLMDGANPPPHRQPSTAVTTPILSYHLSDHLGSVTVSTNAQGVITELSDYYPYGSIRAEEKSKGSSKEQRKYIGQEFDRATKLSYLNARYYDGGRGQFLSQDPVFWEDPLKQNLQNPQSLNSYSYGENNPINKKDADGRSAAGVPLTPFEFVLYALFSPIQGSYDPVYESEQYAAQNNPTNNVMSAAMGMVGGKGGRAVNAEGRLVNAVEGARRESVVFKDLQKAYPGADIVKQPYLRDAKGKIVIDTKKGEARRIDNAVIQNGQVVDRIEVTSQTAKKGPQQQKEQSIINNGGTYIRATDGKLIDFAKSTGGITTPARIIRKP